MSFEVGRGEIFGLLGPNGAGKTTTVEMLEGLRPSDAGELRVLGLDPQREGGALKERIGVQLQTASLYPHLTVAEVIELFASFYPHPAPADSVLEALDLGEKRNAQTRTLSGGQQQRLSVALALVNEPELVFFDEPTTGLDPAARRSLWDLVKDLRAQGRSVLLTTHYMEEAEELCDRLAIMDHGRILDMGTVDQLVSRRFHERAVRFEAVPGLDEDRMAMMDGVRRVAHEDGVVLLYTDNVPATIGAVLDATDELGRPPNDLSVRRATLEDVFLELTGRGLRD
ncbi:MAG TPA: ABC transporter ATP-binding protein [Candidatus Limnocylindrales bacterium]|nr:ABC transporter ATP-binding protein [Candidatus Limnocylindrales bacterium]